MDKIRSKYAALFSTPEDSTDAQPVAGSEEHEGDMEATFSVGLTKVGGDLLKKKRKEEEEKVKD